ncbi:MAG: tetratricopeptide repeat protein [Rhodospirillaceae bacterium]|nr:tetratricopeptide repeat protein [Rhodospirillaceae bacterium]
MPVFPKCRQRADLAEQGDANAQSTLGAMYDHGDGVIQDHKEAVKWRRLAAEQGHARAQAALGFMYRLGRGVIQDSVTAHMWFNIAASNGEEEAAGLRDAVAERMTPADISEAQYGADEAPWR